MAVELIERPGTGEEVKVETGTGIIDHVDDFEDPTNNARRNVRVHIKATHTNLRELVTGWLDTHERFLAQSAWDAMNGGFEVEYRVEVHRKRDVDPTIPIAEVGNRDKVRDLVVLRPKGSTGYDSDSPPPQAATTPAPAPRANQETLDGHGPLYDHFVQQARQQPVVERVAMTSEEADRIEAEETAGRSSAPEPARQVRRGLRVEEAQPWQLYNTDGSLNLGSWAVEAAASMVALAYKLLVENARQEAAAKGGPVTLPSEFTIKGLAGWLLTASDRAQANVRADGCVDRGDRSHARARGAVRAALDVYPVPWGSGQDQRDAWLTTLIDHATMILRLARDLSA